MTKRNKMKTKILTVLCAAAVLTVFWLACSEKAEQWLWERSGIPDVVSSTCDGSECRLTVVANSGCIEDREGFAREVALKYRENSFRSVRFSRDTGGQPSIVDIAVYLKKKVKPTEYKRGALEKCEIANDKVAHPENDGDANTPTENDGGANKLTGEEGCAANAEDGEKSSEIITGQSILEEWQKLKDCHSELTERYDELIKNFVDKVKDPENSADAKSGDMISVSREEWIKRNEADIKLGKSIRDASENLVNILTEVKLYDKEDVVPIKNYVIQCINKILVNIIKGMVEYRPRAGAKFNVYTMKDVTEATGEKLGIIKEVITPGRCVGNYVVEPAEVIRYIETEDKEMGDECLEKEEDVLGNTSGSRSSISHDVSTGSKLCGRKEQHKKQPKQALGKETIAKSSGINTPGQEKDKKN